MYYIPSSCFSSMYSSITNCINTSLPTGGMHFTSSSQILKAETSSEIDQSVQRRAANYKPNIWKYDLLQSPTSNFSEEKYKRKAVKVKEDVTRMFVFTNDLISKLELIDSILDLGLSNYFEEEIEEELDTIGFPEKSISNTKRDLYSSSLCFRLLKQYGYNPSQETFLEFLDENGKFISSPDSNVKGMLELFQASNLRSEGENILKEARLFSVKHLRGVGENSNCKLGKQIFHALSLSLHWKVEWYDIWIYIYDHETENKTNSVLVKLAKLNFNNVQAAHLEDLELSRWWHAMQRFCSTDHTC